MNALAILGTSLLLGLYALLAGIWGVLWALSQLVKGRMYGRLAIAAYLLHALAALTIILSTPLGSGWKSLIVVSSFAFLAIPPMTWRFLRHSHQNGQAES
jgi:hypothetical protein